MGGIIGAAAPISLSFKGVSKKLIAKFECSAVKFTICNHWEMLDSYLPK